MYLEETNLREMFEEEVEDEQQRQERQTCVNTVEK
jgi:hypothetical protein